jgi:putative DNA primase/helicase
LRWRAPRALPVLLVDGEMPLESLRRRLATIALAAPDAPEAEAIPLRILSADHQLDPLPSLATEEGRTLVEPHLDRVKLVILDNVSTLFGSLAENESEAWTPAQEWLLSLRRRGLSVLMLHHAGKGGAQRGTSRREDVLDLVLKLSRPPDYTATEGARFEVHFEKARGLLGDDVEPFEAELRVDDAGAGIWTMKPLTGRRLDQVVELVKEGASARDVAEALEVSRATAFRLISAARETGKLPARAER